MYIWLACIVTVLALMVVHWFPWMRLLQGKKLPRPIEQVLNLASVAAPASISIVITRADADRSSAVLWSTVISGGIVIGLVYLIDDWIDKRARAAEAEAREQLTGEQLASLVEERR